MAPVWVVSSAGPLIRAPATPEPVPAPYTPLLTLTLRRSWAATGPEPDRAGTSPQALVLLFHDVRCESTQDVEMSVTDGR